MQNLVEIIVIGYNLPEIEQACISSIIKNTTYKPYIISFFDNYNSGLSLTEVWNWKIGLSDAEYIVLLNNDTVVHPHWLTKLVSTIGRDEWIRFVGPSTNNCHSIQNTIPTYEEAMKHADEVQIVNEPISGFCLLFPKDVWKQLGGFDERFNFYGAESDFINKGQTRFGWTCAWRKDSFIFHMGGASIKSSNKDEEAERRRARELYWSERRKV